MNKPTVIRHEEGGLLLIPLDFCYNSIYNIPIMYISIKRVSCQKIGIRKEDVNMAIEGIYKNCSGNHYEVVGLAIDIDSKEEFVLYRHMFDFREYWISPHEMFTDGYIIENGYITKFVKVRDSFENMIEKEDASRISIIHSETQNRYSVVSFSKKDDGIICNVRCRASYM